MAKIPVAVLGATGAVGQRFVQLLADHPWFEIAALAASDKREGQSYDEACRWVIPGNPPPSICKMTLSALEPHLPSRLVFSALPAPVAREVEPQFAAAGYVVCSNASAYRYESDVPLIIPEVNADHLILIEGQREFRGWPGFIITSPNCTTTGLALAVKPLGQAFDLQRVFVTTMQAVSGAGYPGIASLDILDNIIPYIEGEEEKIERETKLLLGRIENNQRIEADVVVSAQTNRVPVLDGHTLCLSLGFRRRVLVEEALAVMREYRGLAGIHKLPGAPEYPILVSPEIDRPQPRRDRDTERGMVVTVGRVRACPLMDLRMVVVVHNTMRGAASGSILNAELLVTEGYLQ